MKKLTSGKTDQKRTFRMGIKAAMLLLSVLLMAGYVVPVGADTLPEEMAEEVYSVDSDSDAGRTEEHRQLEITVVEDIPAVEIEESEVPLAALPNTQVRNSVRHAFWMGALLLAVILYVVYFSVRDRRLYQLRREAALAENRLASVRRKR